MEHFKVKRCLNRRVFFPGEYSIKKISFRFYFFNQEITTSEGENKNIASCYE